MWIQVSTHHAGHATNVCSSDMVVAALEYSAILMQANLQLVLKPGF